MFRMHHRGNLPSLQKKNIAYDVMNFSVIFLLFAIIVGSLRLCWNRRRGELTMMAPPLYNYIVLLKIFLKINC